MKQGDIIEREVVIKTGENLTGSGSPDKITELVNSLYPNVSFNLIPLDKQVCDENPSVANQVIAVLASGEIRKREEARVNWVVGDEAAITIDNWSKIIDLREEPEWYVKIESVPSYQSSVAQMSEEELKASIDALRNTRFPLNKKSREPREPAVDRSDPMAVALASLPADKKAELMKKLGMVD